MYTGSVLKLMLGQTATGVLAPELVPVDRICQRWASAVGTGLPSDEWDDDPKSRPPPLDDDTATVVDLIILKSPPKTKTFVWRWYKTPTPTWVIAEEMGMSERSAEKCWNLCLDFLRYKFEESKNMTLLRLLRIRV